MKDPFRRSPPWISNPGAASVLCVLLWLSCPARSQNGEFPPSQTKTTTSKTQSRLSPQALAQIVEPRVPNLIQHTLADARNIVGNQFSVAVAGYRPSTGPPGIVLSQIPEAGQAEKRGTEIEVWLSEPTSFQSRPPPKLVRVPELLGHTRESAIIMLGRVPLPQGDIRARDSEESDGIVLSQDPGPSSMVLPNTPVNFVVSRQIQRTLTLTAPSGGKPGESLTFVAHLDPYFPSTQYQFTFGDRQSSPWDSNPESTHTYSSDGNYEARALARWDGGQATSGSVTVAVHSITYALMLTPAPMRATEGDEIDFRAELNPPVENAVYSFNFGDGTKPASSTSPAARHTYAGGGAFAARVSVLTPDHRHKILSSPVRVMIAAKSPSTIKVMGGWLNQFKFWIIGCLVLLIGGFLLGTLRSGLHSPKRQPETHGNRPEPSVEMHPVIPPGKLTITVQGRLWSRIESLGGKSTRDHTS